jgi:hypothetical protein
MSTYYVHATTGSDANAGTSPAAAWQTLAKVNAARLLPGDSVLFARGQTWTGQLTISWSGTAGNFITFADYGSGARPILDAQSAVNTNTIYNVAQSYLVYRNLDLRNGYSSCCYNDGETGTTTVVPISNVWVINCVLSGAGNDNILFIHDCSTIRILGCESHNAIDAFTNQVSTGIEIADGGSDILIDSCYIHDCPTGISVHCHPPGGSFTNGFPMPTNVTISNTQISHIIKTGISASGNALQFSNGLPPSSPNYLATTVLVTDCTIFDVEITGSGISFGKDINTAANLFGSVTIQRTSVQNCNFYNINIDGADDVLLYRVLQQRGTQTTNRFLRVRNAQRTRLYHVTSYTPVNAGIPLLLIDQNNTSTTEYTDHVTVENCIFASPDTGTPMIQVTPTALQDLSGTTTAKTLTFDYNLYQQDTTKARWIWNQASVSSGGVFSAWQTSTGGESHSSATTTAPFANEAGGVFGLTAGSAARAAGVLLSGVDDHSYSGGAPDLGYLSHLAPPAHTVIIG